jgi:hypothetical protein
MDARLVLVLAVLLFGGTSHAMERFAVRIRPTLSTKNLEKFLSNPRTPVEDVARAVAMARDQMKYEELIEVNSYNDSDCTQAEVEKRKKICQKHKGKLAEYCNHCVLSLNIYCSNHPNEVLVANVASEYLNEIMRFERDLEKFISEVEMSRFPWDMIVESFLAEPEQLESLDQLKVACNNFIQIAERTSSYFDSGRRFDHGNLLLRRGNRAAKERGLIEALDDCEVVVRFDPE